MNLHWTVLLLAALMALQGASVARQADDPAPVVADQPAFYAAVRNNLARAQASYHLFSYKERRTSIQTNPFGKLGTDGVELSQVYPSANPTLTYRRVLLRDGVPLSELEAAKQDREYAARAAEVRRRLEDESLAGRRRRAEEEALARRRARIGRAARKVIHAPLRK